MFEFDSDKNAIINPSDFIKKIDNMPSIGIACFSKILFDNIVKGSKCRLIGELKGTLGNREIYEVEYKNKRMALFNIGVGSPLAVNDLEEVHAMGCNKFIILGNCGVLDKNIDDCSIIIPNKAIRDEGTSYHYLDANKFIDVNKKYKDKFIEILKEYNYSYVEGITWTTDSFYRETKKKLEDRKKMGAICVEMECSALQAVCDFREMDLFIFFYAGDNLDNDKWDKRSLEGEIKLDSKSKIALLAFELGIRI